MKINLKVSSMYWMYNILLLMYWAALIPMLIYRLFKEEGFYQRIKQSIGYLPDDLKRKISDRHAIWVHAASVGEIVAASPIVREMRKTHPNEVIIVSVVTATGFRMAHQIIKGADGILYFPLDLPYFTNRILSIVKPKIIVLVETEIWPNFLRIADNKQIPVMMMNGRISQRSAVRYRLITFFTRRVLSTIRIFCMQSRIDAQYIIDIGADPNKVIVTGNTKYDQTYGIVTEEEKKRFLHELGFAEGTYPIMIAGSTHKGENSSVYKAFCTIRREFPKARLIIAPRYIYQADLIRDEGLNHKVSMVKRSDMKAGKIVSPSYDGVILDTIGELGRVYSLGDLIFVGGSLAHIGGHNILEPAAHGKPIVVGPNMFNFVEIFDLLSRRGACAMVRNETEFISTCLDILVHKKRAEQMMRSCIEVVQENQGATKKNLEELQRLLNELY
ncbi:3-deoxy-D-manno-octulosonic acid transferase [Megasphaera cerevisiae DSM 20462]|uniref:3-deoxy-D-manno-octulosonic acid transferase n=2 Tax=Megasphaera TaxID=906 RepID=A0A0J6WYS9_9FIRM|nr:3-deoxy-D-manno-octulosonic acid transferase [Megasphaera cerevisiae]KMO87002.1 3-deoxy-D-manno-octulosonic acid transferase [Megasphaera cerevisiae DSM 20462]MCI1750539.1 3-deoxy-D-manno-octulosonic acid transferase [Megasphaera cerevisiae]OKY54035.1 3-deoxy-D-manno-octulosonic acid transferase [Megasphaera cerevisiae]SJZ82388.1 3-deoxy-D-manno-octulosonic-acid transferase [Megasphaera cerevisiae DSM 20462]